MPATTLVVFGALRFGSRKFGEVTAVGAAGLKPPAAVMNWFRFTSFACAKWSPLRSVQR